MQSHNCFLWDYCICWKYWLSKTNTNHHLHLFWQSFFRFAGFSLVSETFINTYGFETGCLSVCKCFPVCFASLLSCQCATTCYYFFVEKWFSNKVKTTRGRRIIFTINKIEAIITSISFQIIFNMILKYYDCIKPLHSHHHSHHFYQQLFVAIHLIFFILLTSAADIQILLYNKIIRYSLLAANIQISCKSQ